MWNFRFVSPSLSIPLPSAPPPPPRAPSPLPPPPRPGPPPPASHPRTPLPFRLNVLKRRQTPFTASFTRADRLFNQCATGKAPPLLLNASGIDEKRELCRHAKYGCSQSWQTRDHARSRNGGRRRPRIAVEPLGHATHFLGTREAHAARGCRAQALGIHSPQS